MKARWPIVLALVLLAAGGALVALALGRFWAGDSRATPSPSVLLLSSPLPSATPSSQPSRTLRPSLAPTLTEPILPPPPTASASPLPLTVAASNTAELLTTPAALPTPTPLLPTVSPVPPAEGLFRPRQRLGAGSGAVEIEEELSERLGLGWYLDWRVRPEAFRSPEVAYVPMIRLREGKIVPDGEELRTAVRAMPGALWLVGNEPDVKWQDNVRPEAYAAAYRHVYTLLKSEDPACQVAIGGISQPTPLRLRYLEQILAAYEEEYGEPMPVDVWNVHNFILREERESWGVDIPPGMEEENGRLFEIADHDDMGIFRQQIVDFRRWMKEQGQQDKPLIVTEYGILMPAEYGFPPERAEAFMLETFEFFRTATDPDLGYPADGYRLVQRWCWYSLYDPRYPTGNLLNPEDRILTPLGEAFAAYATRLR